MVYISLISQKKINNNNNNKILNTIKILFQEKYFSYPQIFLKHISKHSNIQNKLSLITKRKKKNFH